MDGSRLRTWAKETDKLGLRERRLPYTIGLQLRRGRSLNAKQVVQAKRVLERARELGYRSVGLPSPAGDTAHTTPEMETEERGLETSTGGTHPQPGRRESSATEMSPLRDLDEPFDPSTQRGPTEQVSTNSGAHLVGTSLENLDHILGVRARNSLNGVGIHTLETLAERTVEEIRGIPYLGTMTMRDIEDALRQHGLRFRGSPAYSTESASEGPLEQVLGVRARNCLRGAGIHRLEDLTSRTAEEVKYIPNLGSKSMREIEGAMRQHGLSFLRSHPRASEPPERSNGRPDGRRVAGSDDEETIVSMRELGMPLREIADSVGISAERVRQILAASGRDLDPRYLAQVRREGRLEEARGGSAGIMEGFRRGLSAAAVATQLGLDGASVSHVWEENASESDRAERRRSSGRANREPSYSDDDLIDAIRSVAQVVDRVPSTKDYAERSPRLGLPSLPTVTNRFGTWIAAVERAGMTPNAAFRTYSRTWDAEACRAAMRSVVEELDRVPSVSHYEALARSRDDLPSLATVRNRLGRWSELAAELARERTPD